MNKKCEVNMNKQTVREYYSQGIAHLFKNRHKYKNHTDYGFYRTHYCYAYRTIREDIESIRKSDNTPFNITRRMQRNQAKIAKLQQEQFELQHLLKLSLGGIK